MTDDEDWSTGYNYCNATPLICILPCVFHTDIIITCPYVSVDYGIIAMHVVKWKILKFGISHISLCHVNCPIYLILVVSSTWFHPLFTFDND